MFATLLVWFNKSSVFTLLTVLTIFAFIIYSNTFINGLFFDDEHFIYNNSAVTSFSLSDIFSKSLTTGAGTLSNYYRPLLFTGFAIEYALFGATGFIYHLNSLILHTGAGIMVYVILLKLFKNKFVAFLTSLLFLIHPIQTEAVSYASGRGDPQSLFFSLLAVYFSLRSTLKSRIFASFCLIFALLSKELALITPGLIFICIFFQNPTFSKKHFIATFKKALPFIIISITYFALRLTVLNFSNTLNFHNSENEYTQSLIVRLSTFFDIFPQYLSLILFPMTLFMERDVTIKIQPLPTIAAIASLIGILTALTVAVLHRKSYPFFLFGLLWIGISFIPTSGIIPINGIFYEHFLYYPSIGIFLIISFTIYPLLKRTNSLISPILILLLTLSLVLLSLRTISRNAEWRNAIVFYKQTLQHAQSSRILNNLAMAYAEQGDITNAIKTYNKAIAIGDVHPETRYNLGNAYLQVGDLKKAENEYKKTLRINPGFYFAYQRLMAIYIAQNNSKGKQWVIEKVEELVKINASFAPLLQELKNEN